MIAASPSEHRDPGVDKPFISRDLPFELARLQASREYAADGHAGRTLTKYPEVRVVLESMRAGERLSMHGTSEELTLQVLLGQLRVRMRYGESFELAEGSFVAIDAGQVHEIEALRDCGFLLTLAWPPMQRSAP